MSPTDATLSRLLVLRARAGDEEAFVEIVSRHGARLRYYLVGLTGRPHVAEDLLQETWLVAWRRLRTLREPDALTTWLYRIARNLAVKALRRERAWEPLPDEPVAEEDESDFGAEDAAAIHAALQCLNPVHRDVLLLQFMEGLTYEQIAEAVGCPVGTVRSRLHHARRALREQLVRDAPDTVPETPTTPPSKPPSTSGPTAARQEDLT